MSQSTSIDMLIPLAVILITVGLYRYVLYPAFVSPLSKIPTAHWSCSVSAAWILWARFVGRENRTLHRAHLEKGDIVRIGPQELSINSADGVKTIYQGGFDKHPWYSVFNNYGVPNVFSSLESKHHSLRKRMVSNVYSKSYLAASASLAAQSHAILNHRLLPVIESSMHQSQKPRGIDVQSLFFAVAMDFISAYCFGMQNSTDFIRRKNYREHWLKVYETRKGYSFFEQELPAVSSVMRRLGINLTPTWVAASNKELETWCKRMSDAAIHQLEMRDPNNKPTPEVDSEHDPVVVRALMAGLDKERETRGRDSLVYSTGVLQRDLSIASEVIDHVLAGHETTGVALTYATYHLSKDLDLQARLRAELLSASAAPTATVHHPQHGSSSSIPFSPRHLDTLSILHAVITETVRRYAPAGGPEPRVTPSSSSSSSSSSSPSGCRIGPFDGIPRGTRVSASVYNLHRDERVFPDPETWDPARWLWAVPPPLQRPRGEGEGRWHDEGGGGGRGGAAAAAAEATITPEAELAAAQRMQRQRQFWGFSSGGRMCLGSNFAMQEMKLVLATIYSRYTTHVVDDRGIEPSDAYTGRPVGGALFLEFERADSSSTL